MHDRAPFAQVRDVLAGLGPSLPDLLVATVLLLVGGAVAFALRALGRRITDRALRRFGREPAVADALETGGIRATIATVVGGFVFWLVLLVFLAGAIERLGLPLLTGLLNQVTAYLPNVLAAILIVIGGIVVGQLAGRAVTAGARSADIGRADALGRLVQGAILLVAAIVGLEQVGIQGQLFVVIVAVVFATFLGGTGLAFGLGARTAVSNIIASHYVSQTYRPGQVVKIGDIQGRIVETTRTTVVVSTDEGRVYIPAMKFSEESSVLLTEAR